MTYAPIKTDVVIEITQPIYDKNVAILAKVKANWKARKEEVKRRYDEATWLKIFISATPHMDEHYAYLNEKMQPAYRVRKTRGILALCAHSANGCINLSRKDAEWLGLDIE